MPFVIRSEGFMYNDEYNAPIGYPLMLIRRVYATREEAEEVLDRLQRERLRAAPGLYDYLWDLDRETVDALMQLLEQLFPEGLGDPHEVVIPQHATDDQLDEIVRVARLGLAEIHEVEEEPPPEEEPPFMDEADYGSPALYLALTRYEPAPWPPGPPTRDHLEASDACVQVAWDWVAAHPADAGPVARSEARQRARELGLSWYQPVHRALVTFAPDVDELRELLQRA